MFDPTHSGYVDISMFKQILKTKHVSASDVNEMIEGMLLVSSNRYVYVFLSNSNSNCFDVWQSTDGCAERKERMLIMKIK